MTAYKSPLGLSGQHRQGLRLAALRSANVALRNALSVHYTEGPARWSGIADQRRGWLGEYPSYADCSSFFTWCHWDASRFLHMEDYINGDSWEGGFTGTMVQHGESIHPSQLMVADAVFYGTNPELPSHVAFYAGNGRVISHGSEAGPLYLPYNYREALEVRRYIR